MASEKPAKAYQTFDIDIRRAMRGYLTSQPGGGRLVEEMGVMNGSVRVDLALLSTPMIGIELKSDRDTLARLPSQMKIYNQVFGRMILVVGPKHLAKALALVPAWWSVIVATWVDEAVVLAEARAGFDNPNLNPVMLARLLWRDEALALLKEHGLDKGWRTKRVGQLHKRISTELAPPILIEAVSRTLSGRVNWKPGVKRS